MNKLPGCLNKYNKLILVHKIFLELKSKFQSNLFVYLINNI
jgi:hypothetical protein